MSGHTSWTISPEWGFPDSLVLWLWVDGWCFPRRLIAGDTHPMLLPAPPPIWPAPLPTIVNKDLP